MILIIFFCSLVIGSSLVVFVFPHAMFPYYIDRSMRSTDLAKQRDKVYRNLCNFAANMTCLTFPVNISVYMNS